MSKFKIDHVFAGETEHEIATHRVWSFAVLQSRQACR